MLFGLVVEREDGGGDVEWVVVFGFWWEGENLAGPDWCRLCCGVHERVDKRSCGDDGEEEE